MGKNRRRVRGLSKQGVGASRCLEHCPQYPTLCSFHSFLLLSINKGVGDEG
jgi:hypothetical protein